MTQMLHKAGVRQKLRRFRPYYNAVFRRQKDLSGAPSAHEMIELMGGRGVFMFSFGRSGTTVFADFLASHPEVATFGEVLNEDSYYSFFRQFTKRDLRWWTLRPSHMEVAFYQYLERLVRNVPGHKCLFDLKIESLHMVEGNWRMPGPEFKLFEALQDTDAPVILLERKDLVARHVSGQVALKRGQYHSYHGAGEIAPFEIDIARMEYNIGVLQAQMRHIQTRFADHERFLHLVYEDLFEQDADGGTGNFRADLPDRMMDFLGVGAGFDTTPALARMSSNHPSELILNWDAVAEARARLLPDLPEMK